MAKGRRGENSGGQNFEDLANNWHLFKDKIVLLLGAGASNGALNKDGQPLPGGYELRNRLWAELKEGPTKPFDPATIGLMSLEHAAAIIESKTGREPISRFLIKQFDCEKPLWQHLVIQHLNPRTIVTTNYDELIELGFAATGRLVDVVCDGRHPKMDRTAVYKPHGSLSLFDEPLGKGRLVITQFDYYGMIAEYRKMLSNAMGGFGTGCVIAVGYSFGDMDIGAEIYDIRRQNMDIPWYAVFPRDDPHMRKMYSKHLGIEQIPMAFDEFLSELDARVNFIPTEHKFTKRTKLATAGLIQASPTPP